MDFKSTSESVNLSPTQDKVNFSGSCIERSQMSGSGRGGVHAYTNEVSTFGNYTPQQEPNGENNVRGLAPKLDAQTLFAFGVSCSPRF